MINIYLKIKNILKTKNKFWIGPMVFSFILFGILIVFSQGEVTPFFYKIFD